ncbi:hypothetical protein DY000_02006716 [Brassica cretica]|uniref:NADH dehydrogenase [ubiquinone] 1 beta subcomplex subunit 7 n=1 Tax=Brassica cretica TaxID=69181 RepID=A0ABQ7BSG5_BRACR|nr:hypothetical protein DY000_02006716 [Brassica cretica]
MPGGSVAPQFLCLEGARIRFCSEKQQWRYGRCPVLKLKHLDKCQESQKESREGSLWVCGPVVMYRALEHNLLEPRYPDRVWSEEQKPYQP